MYRQKPIARVTKTVMNDTDHRLLKTTRDFIFITSPSPGYCQKGILLKYVSMGMYKVYTSFTINIYIYRENHISFLNKENFIRKKKVEICFLKNKIKHQKQTKKKINKRQHKKDKRNKPSIGSHQSPLMPDDDQPRTGTMIWRALSLIYNIYFPFRLFLSSLSLSLYLSILLYVISYTFFFLYFFIIIILQIFMLYNSLSSLIDLLLLFCFIFSL